METECNYEKYIDLLRKNYGMLTIGMKIPVRDLQALSLVYTPGVAASCLEIKKNIGDAYKYTNKLNSMIVVTDSSAFKDYDPNNWNNMEPIPYLEAMCVYYKLHANIDCYPIIFDHKLTPDGKTIAETIKVMMEAYSLVEFFSIDPKRVEEYHKVIGDHCKFGTISHQGKRETEETLRKHGYPVSVNLIYAAVSRAALDTQAYCDLDCVCDFIVQQFEEKKVKHELNDIYGVMEELVCKAADYIMKNKLSKQTTKEYNLNQEELSVEYVTNKYRRYINEGEKSWVDVFPDNYFTKQGDTNENSLLFHARYKGFVGTKTTMSFRNILSLDKLMCWRNLDKLSKLFHEDPKKSFIYSCRANLGAIITNGTAILGLGDIGSLPGLPVMEGKSILFKLFGGTNIVPICIQEKNPKTLIEICKRISPIFCVINLEDIKAPECFEVERTLIDCIPYPVFHDDQHGTAIVALAGIINAIKLTGKKPENVKVIMNGAGAAGLSVTDLLIHHGIKNFTVCDTVGAIYSGRPKNMNPFKEILAEKTNLDKKEGNLEEMLKGADIFIGLSAAGALKPEWIKNMNEKPIANPTPEIVPDLAKEAGANIVATGRSDFPNQVNNSLCFPRLFRAAVDTRASKISIDMKEAAAMGIASLVSDEELAPNFVIPGSLDPRVSIAVTNAVAKTAVDSKLSNDPRMTNERVQENIQIWNLEDQILNWEDIEEHKNKWQPPKK